MMANKSTSSSHISILVGSGSESNSEETNDDTESDLEGRCCSLDESTLDEDVVPTYVLKPTEISKNIDLMRTVAILMEGKLRNPPAKSPDHEKIRDLHSDIHRFPEAFQKFTSIVHQIQYLNVTTEWEHSSSFESAALESESGNIFTRVFGTSLSKRGSTQQIHRKNIMLNLLSDTQKVFKRYQAIQNMLEDRLKKYNKLMMIKKSAQRNKFGGTDGGGEIIDTEDDDPQTPLLSDRGMGLDLDYNNQNSQNSHDERLIHKFKLMGEILAKTRKSGTEVQDSIDVLRDIIRWDHKQAISDPNTEIRNQQSYANRRESSLGSSLPPSHANSPTTIILPEVEFYQNNNSSSTHRLNPSQFSSTVNGTGINRKLLIVLSILISLILILSIITAALSFLKFRY